MTLYKAARSKVTRMWTMKDEEGIGKNAQATMDDVLLSPIFEKCLDLARRDGANGQLHPIFNNYHTDIATIQ